MKYHILGEHPQLGRTLTGYWYSLAACRRNHKRLEDQSLADQATPGRVWWVVRCLEPDNPDCTCSRDDTFEVVPAN